MERRGAKMQPGICTAGVYDRKATKKRRQSLKRFVKEYLWGEELGEPGYEFTRGHYKRGVE